MNNAEMERDDVRPEYDLQGGRPNPWAAKMKVGTNLVVIDADLFKIFPSGEAVNQALRLLVRAGVEAVRPDSVEEAKAS